MREGDHGNADNEHNSAQRHERLASHPIRQQSCEQRRNHATQQHRGNHEGELAGVQARGRFQIRQRAGNDADVYPVEQAAQARHDQKKAVIKNLFVVEPCGNASCDLSSHRILCTELFAPLPIYLILRTLTNWLSF